MRYSALVLIAVLVLLGIYENQQGTSSGGANAVSPAAAPAQHPIPAQGSWINVANPTAIPVRRAIPVPPNSDS